MRAATGNLKDWLLPVAAVCGVIFMAGLALNRKLNVAGQICELASLGAMLSNAAVSVQETTLSTQQAAELKTRREDLERRMQDSCRPALVQAQLVEGARKAGLEVQEIIPTQVSTHGGPSAEDQYPSYRVSVHGRYQQVADYLESAKTLRFPVRVRRFRISRRPGEGSADGSLAAEIVMESFRPPTKEEDPKGKA